ADKLENLAKCCLFSEQEIAGEPALQENIGPTSEDECNDLWPDGQYNFTGPKRINNENNLMVYPELKDPNEDDLEEYNSVEDGSCEDGLGKYGSGQQSQ